MTLKPIEYVYLITHFKIQRPVGTCRTCHRPSSANLWMRYPSIRKVCIWDLRCSPLKKQGLLVISGVFNYGPEADRVRLWSHFWAPTCCRASQQLDGVGRLLDVHSLYHLVVTRHKSIPERPELRPNLDSNFVQIWMQLPRRSHPNLDKAFSGVWLMFAALRIPLIYECWYR